MTPRRSQTRPAPPWKDIGVTPDPAENYERFFVPAIGGPVATEFVRKAAVASGERVLDVACGTGVVTRLVAGSVGQSGVVAGLDVHPAMLAVARTRTPVGVPLEWHEASAQHMPLPDGSFQVVLCQLGLMLFDSPAAALAEMHRVLAPSGRLLVNVPAHAGPLFATAEEEFERHLGPAAAGFVRAVFSLGDPDTLRKLVQDAGFTDVVVRRDAMQFRLPAPREFLWQYVFSTPLASIVAEADPEQLERLEDAVATRWEAYRNGQGMRSDQDILTVTARK